MKESGSRVFSKMTTTYPGENTNSDVFFYFVSCLKNLNNFLVKKSNNLEKYL